MKNGAVAESGAQAGEYPNVDISKHILQRLSLMRRARKCS
nr:MAG TPA: hypothetical protein [Bacteriophage sp.]